MATPSASQSSIDLNLAIFKGMYIAFILLITMKTLVWPPLNKAPSVIIFILQILPILPFAHGIFSNKRRHIAGFCYVLLIYFVALGANIFVPALRVYTWLGLFLVVSMYSSGMMHVRWTRAGVDVRA